MPSASRQKVKEIAAKLSKGERTVRRWIQQGLDITSEESIRQFVEGKRHKRTNFQRAREKIERAFETAEVALNGKAAGRNGRNELIGDKDLPPPSRRGAAAALERLEATEGGRMRAF